MTNDTPVTWEIPMAWGALCQKLGGNTKYIYYTTSKLKDAGGGGGDEGEERMKDRKILYVEKRITPLLTKTNKWTNNNKNYWAISDHWRQRTSIKLPERKNGFQVSLTSILQARWQ